MPLASPTPISPPSHTDAPPPTPVELDGSPVLTKSPDSSLIPASTNQRTGRLPPARRGSSAEPGADSEMWEEISGEKGMGSMRIEERAQQRALKSADPAVVIDLPSTPAAQDYEVAAKNPYFQGRTASPSPLKPKAAVSNGGDGVKGQSNNTKRATQDTRRSDKLNA